MSFSMKAAVSAAVLVVALAGAAFAATTPATPTPVAGTPALTELKIDIGLTADMISRGKQLQEDMVKFGYQEGEVDDWCASKSQIREGLVRAGFNDMDVVDRLTQFRLRVEALYLADGWVYSMQVNKCTGEVSVIAPIYFAADLD